LVAAAEELGGMQSWRARVPGQAEYRTTCAALVKRAMDQGVRFVGRDDYPASAAAKNVWRVRRWEPVARLQHTSVPSRTSYEILRGKTTGVPARLLVVGDDLSSADAALLLADRGHDVTLRSFAGDIAVDAHPGFRLLNRSLLERRGAQIEIGVAQDELMNADGFDALVVGRCRQRTSASRRVLISDFGAPADACLDDAYEQGH